MKETRSRSTWDDASSTAIAPVIRRFESDWRSSPADRPDPREYLPDAPERSPAILLALLRADLVLRREACEPRPMESYREDFPELDDDAMVALLYEDYCLREEAGESPRGEDYSARFPDLARSFAEVLEIHELVGRAPIHSSLSFSLPEAGMPDAGQTIAGYRLVEELGRGAFGRVYLAEERHLADRPVALKVTRTGSREPQTLARLQHTHIVPVYSYRTDPASGLHLLCMPYLGRITLLHILNDPAVRSARSGTDLLALIDRLQSPDSDAQEREAIRGGLGRRTYAQAIAWWGARMAEALQHAHDRGVLHRDVKPSNVLVTGEGLPMLLDFNLALDPRIDDPAAHRDGLGGTLAYMAPEHLEALASGSAECVDARSDLYALGVVLYDCLVRSTGTFSPLSISGTITDSLLRAAEARRAGPPRLRAEQPDVPPAMEAVVRRCLAPDPDDRYASASELASDLQAVADDGPLRFTHEPIASRCLRWLRRNRRRLALAIPIIVGLALAARSLLGARIETLRLESEVEHEIVEGDGEALKAQFDRALGHYALARRLAESNTKLNPLCIRIDEKSRRVRDTKEIRDQVDRLSEEGERLRFSLLGFGGELSDALRSVQSALSKFSVPEDRDWMRRPPMELLDAPHRDRLVRDVNELLYLWCVALDRERHGDPSARLEGVRICDAAMAFARPLGPWRGLRDRLAAEPGELPSTTRRPRDAEVETSARGCFQWAMLCELEGRDRESLGWLERAAFLEQGDYWTQFYLGYYCGRTGQHQRALEHYQAAVSLRPESPWGRLNRAILFREGGDWDRALDELNRILTLPQGKDLSQAWLELGFMKQVLGDEAGARAAYEAVIATGSEGDSARARLNRAKLDMDAGATQRAWAEYHALLGEDPRNASARFSRTLLALRLGHNELAEADLSLLLRDAPERSDEILARRAIARLALGRLEDAEADARGAFRRRPTPSRERLWVRILLALRRVEDLHWLDQPDDLDLLPMRGASLRADLRAAAEKLGPASVRSNVAGRSAACRTRAVILCALDSPDALAEATRAVEASPESAEAYLVRSRIRRRCGDRNGALADAEAGLRLAPGDPRLLELRGQIKLDAGNPAGAIVDLDRALMRGATGAVRRHRARALCSLGKYAAAVREWGLAADLDPEDPRVYLGRAMAEFRLGQVDRVILNLEQAADRTADQPGLLTRIALANVPCLATRPARFPRWLALVRRAVTAWAASVRPEPAG